jgi:drug/metabolite transporter (DMT)-like permease
MGVGVGDTVFFQSLPRLGSGLALLLIECLQAPFGVLIEWLWLGTQLTPRQLLFGAIILAGVGVALAPTERRKIARKDFLLGVGFCAVAALATAFGAVLSRKGYSVPDPSGLALDPGTVAFQRVLGGLLPAALVLLAVKRREFKIQVTAPRRLVFEVSKRKWKGIWPWVLANGLAGQTLGVACMQKALETTPTGIVLAIIAVTPIVVIPFAWIFEGDRPSLHSVLGGLVAVAGVAGLLLKG